MERPTSAGPPFLPRPNPFLKRNPAVRTTLHRYTTPLTFFVLGASGDLALKKTYPSLFSLYTSDLLPPRFQIVGYARTAKSVEEFRERIGGNLKGEGKVRMCRGGEGGCRGWAQKV